jgi:hypothetical protein
MVELNDSQFETSGSLQAMPTTVSGIQARGAQGGKRTDAFGDGLLWKYSLKNVLVSPLMLAAVVSEPKPEALHHCPYPTN